MVFVLSLPLTATNPALYGKVKKTPPARDQKGTLPKQGTRAIPSNFVGRAALPIRASQETKPKITMKLSPHAQALYDLLVDFTRALNETNEAVLGRRRKKSLSEQEQREFKRAKEIAINKAKTLLNRVKNAKDVGEEELRKCINELQKLEALLNKLGASSIKLSKNLALLKEMLIAAEDIGQAAKKNFNNALKIYVMAKKIINKKGRLEKEDLEKIIGCKISDEAWEKIFHGGISSTQQFGKIWETLALNVNAFGTSLTEYCSSKNIVLVGDMCAPVKKAFGQNYSKVFASRKSLKKVLEALNDKASDLGSEYNIRHKEQLRKIFKDALQRIRENSKPSDIEQAVTACVVSAIRNYIYNDFKDTNNEEPKAPERMFNEFIGLAKDKPEQFKCLVRIFLNNGSFTKENFEAAKDGKLVLGKIPAPVLPKIGAKRTTSRDIKAMPAAKGR
jgi:hypothetical protein